MDRLDWNETERLFQELICGQEEKLYRCAERVVPGLTKDDLLQPNDYPQLENYPHFRYEEGVLEGLRTAYVALRAEVSERR